MDAVGAAGMFLPVPVLLQLLLRHGAGGRDQPPDHVSQVVCLVALAGTLCDILVTELEVVPGEFERVVVVLHVIHGNVRQMVRAGTGSLFPVVEALALYRCRSLLYARRQIEPLEAQRRRYKSLCLKTTVHPIMQMSAACVYLLTSVDMMPRPAAQMILEFFV